MFIRKQHTKVCETFTKIEIVFFLLTSHRVTAIRKYLTLRGTFYTTNRNIKKASNSQLAHHLLSDIVQSLWMSVVTQRLAIQFSMYSSFCIYYLRLPIAYQNKTFSDSTVYQLLITMIFSFPRLDFRVQVQGQGFFKPTCTQNIFLHGTTEGLQ